jgi:hypothetical protein
MLPPSSYRRILAQNRPVIKPISPTYTMSSGTLMIAIERYASHFQCDFCEALRLAIVRLQGVHKLDFFEADLTTSHETLSAYVASRINLQWLLRYGCSSPLPWALWSCAGKIKDRHHQVIVDSHDVIIWLRRCTFQCGQSLLFDRLIPLLRPIVVRDQYDMWSHWTCLKDYVICFLIIPSDFLGLFAIH